MKSKSLPEDHPVKTSLSKELEALDSNKQQILQLLIKGKPVPIESINSSLFFKLKICSQ